MGKPAISYRSKSITEAIKKIKRSRYAPVSFQQKAHLIAAACLPMAVYGSELQLPTQDQCAKLRRAVSAAMFKGFTWCRSPVPTVSLILPEHRVDAKQAYIYHVLSLVAEFSPHVPLSELCLKSLGRSLFKDRAKLLVLLRQYFRSPNSEKNGLSPG